MAATLDMLLADLAEAGVGGHTRAAVVRRVAESLARSCPLVAVELGWCDARSTRASVATAHHSPQGWEVAEGTRSLRGTRAQRVLRLGQPHAAPPSQAFPDDAAAASCGAEVYVILPLLFGEGEPGYASLSLSGALPEVMQGAGLHTVSRVLRVAHSNCSLIEKVATVSRRAHARNAELRHEVDRLSRAPRVVASSEAMRTTLERLDAVAAHDTSVLILGESGTGKSLLAQRIHARSPRASAPFVAVNCGALPESLIESELFGHVAGAFTGARSAHRGRFERATGGTLFLDEVGELPLSAQVKLLRALQEGRIEPLGSERELQVDVRVIAATNQPLEQRVSAGEFREDLYYRLSVFPVVVPALRERREDLPELVAQLLAEIATRLRRPTPRVSPATLRRLADAPWPGNVRQLANTLERSLIFSQGEDLELAADVPPATGGAVLTPPQAPTFEQTVRACIERALRSAGGKLYGEGGAAEALGLHPSTLQTKMRKLGISRAQFVR